MKKDLKLVVELEYDPALTDVESIMLDLKQNLETEDAQELGIDEVSVREEK